MDYKEKFFDVRVAIWLIAVAVVLLALVGRFVLHKLSH
jgi:hypothetical protein